MIGEPEAFLGGWRSGSGDCPRYGLDFRETGELVRSCWRDVTTNRSRHRLPWKMTCRLDPVQCSRCDSHVVENYAFSGFDRPNAKRQTPTAYCAFARPRKSLTTICTSNFLPSLPK